MFEKYLQSFPDSEGMVITAAPDLERLPDLWLAAPRLPADLWPLLAEVKNEMGSTTGDPGLQCALYYAGECMCASGWVWDDAYSICGQMVDMDGAVAPAPPTPQPQRQSPQQHTQARYRHVQPCNAHVHGCGWL
jgi:hypothetical protein